MSEEERQDRKRRLQEAVDDMIAIDPALALAIIMFELQVINLQSGEKPNVSIH